MQEALTKHSVLQAGEKRNIEQVGDSAPALKLRRLESSATLGDAAAVAGPLAPQLAAASAAKAAAAVTAAAATAAAAAAAVAPPAGKAKAGAKSKAKAKGKAGAEHPKVADKSADTGAAEGASGTWVAAGAEPGFRRLVQAQQARAHHETRSPQAYEGQAYCRKVCCGRLH